MSFLLSDLVDAIQDNRAVAVVGSGLSTDVGAPNWQELLFGLASLAEDICDSESRRQLAQAIQDTGQHHFLDAATSIKQLFSSAIHFRKAVVWWLNHDQRAQIDWSAVRGASEGKAGGRMTRRIGSDNPRALQPSTSHRILTQLGFRAIVTTNYDMLLETAIASPNTITVSHSYPHLTQLLQGRHRFIFHLHGDVVNFTDIVMADEDYQKLVSRPDIISFLKKLFADKIVFWIGYGHRDPDFWLVTSDNLEQNVDGGCAVVCDDENKQRTIRTLAPRNIAPLLVKNYEKVPELLNEIFQATGRRLFFTCGLRIRVKDHREMDSQGDKLGKVFSGLGYDMSQISEGLVTSGALLFEAMNAVGRNVTDHFLINSGARLPKDVLDPPVEVRPDGARPQTEDLFESWSSVGPGDDAKRITVVASPGAGKTVLLTRFAHWLRESHGHPDAVPGLRPIVLFMKAAHVPTAVSADTIWESLQQRANDARAGYDAAYQPGILEPFRRSGLVYLLFDGLDEFGSRRKGDLENLMEALRCLAEERQVHVCLSCRRVFWDQQVEGKAGWNRVEILPFTEEQIMAKISRESLGPFAYEDGHLRLDVVNPLILSFLIGLRDEEPELELAGFHTRSQLYDSWVHHATKKAHETTGIEAARWLEDFDDIAFRLLADEKLSVSPPRRTNGQRIQFHQYLATEIVKPLDDGVEFFHPSVSEFFTARALAQSFQEVVRSAPDVERIRLLPLGRVDLDFYPTSVYGFLCERLGADFVDKLLVALRAYDLSRLERRLLRNLIEYVGMTYRGGPGYSSVIRWLVSLIGNGDLHFEIRYNAARAVERIHAWAPQPYFDYMSDWGEKDWSAKRRSASRARIRPLAIRGYKSTEGKKRRRPGDYPSLFVSHTSNIDGELQREVSAELLRVIESLLARWQLADSAPAGQRESSKKDQKEIDWLLINCSYALVRWYHEDHREHLDRLRAESNRVNAGQHVRSNLDYWVGHPFCVYPPTKFPFCWVPREAAKGRPARVAVLVADPQTTLPVVSVQPEWNRGSGIVRGACDPVSGELLEDHMSECLDASGRLVSSARPVVGASAMREGVWSIDEHIENFRADDEREVVAWTGNGNLLSNPYFVGFARAHGRHELFHLRSETPWLGNSPESRDYRCLVVWRHPRGDRKSRVTIERLRFWCEADVPQVFSVSDGRLVTDEILCATSGQPLVEDGRPLDRDRLVMMATAGLFYDLRHLLLFGRLRRGDDRWFDAGLADFWKADGGLDRDLLAEALRGEVVSLDVAQLDEEEVAAALLEKGYAACSSPEDPGQFSLSGGRLNIVFFDGIYPHHVIGIREDGRLLSVAVSGSSNRVGVSLAGAAEIAGILGARDALLIDNGGDVTMGYANETVVGPDEGARNRLRSMILFVRTIEAKRKGLSGRPALLQFPDRYPPSPQPRN